MEKSNIKKSVQILEYLKGNPSSSSSDIHERGNLDWGYATTKRILQKLLSENLILSSGKGRGTKYSISPAYNLLSPVNVEHYFEKEIDERKIQNNFNYSLIKETLPKISVFTDEELKHLNNLQNQFRKKSSLLSANEYKIALERLTIDLSWKSSQIEGNTYSLLETERLLKEKETAAGKTKDEATMLLNHKEALDFILKNPTYADPLSVSIIEDIHSILIKDLNIDRNIRKHVVGISGTNYKPPDNEFQIREALSDMCDSINNEENIFTKTLLVLVLISYIQPFSDGNKRTARIIANALLIKNNYCPVSFRTVHSFDYKKAMLIFYEQNNITAMKKIFVEQFEWAVGEYF